MRKLGGFSVTALAAAFVATLATSQSAYAAVQTCSWTGTAGDNKFSTATNWTNCNNSTPQAGDIIEFKSTVLNQSEGNQLINDLDVAFGNLYFNDDDGVLGGSPIASYIDKLSFANGARVHSNVPAYDGGSNRDSWLHVLGTITSQGSLDVDTWALSGSVFNMPGQLTIGAGHMVYLDASNVGSYIVNKGADLVYMTDNDSGHFNLNLPPITLEDGPGAKNTAIYINAFCPPESGDVRECYNYVPMTVNILSKVTANGPAKVSTQGSSVINFVNINDFSKLSLLTEYPLTDGSITSENALPASAVKTIDNSNDKKIAVGANQTIVLGGSRAAVYVSANGVLKGKGNVTGKLNIEDNGKVAPGLSPGCLTVGELTVSGDYQFELGGTDACTGYDQIVVNDIVTLGATAQLLTSRYNNYTPTQNQVFTIINNKSANAVEGTFAGLAEGATFEQNGVVFKISYKGGDGNDVTLTVQNVPTVPNTGFELIKANPIITLAISALAAVILFGFAKRSMVRR